jgi:hypothetical protein
MNSSKNIMIKKQGASLPSLDEEAGKEAPVWTKAFEFSGKKSVLLTI